LLTRGGQAGDAVKQAATDAKATVHKATEPTLTEKVKTGASNVSDCPHCPFY